MAVCVSGKSKIAGIVTGVPSARISNKTDTIAFSKEEVRKVVAMAGVAERRIATANIRSTDLCAAAAEELLRVIGWERDTVEALIMVTQTPDYFLPSASCLVHRRLGLSENCAAFDLGQGCSGYVYGLWIASMMLNSGGMTRVLVLHGETPTLYADQSDRAVALLFGDAGSATALERKETDNNSKWFFTLHTDGKGYDDLIVEAGGFRDRFCRDMRKHFVRMNGANIFNFTIKVVPRMIDDVLKSAGVPKESIDYFIFHQSNRFIIRHLMAKSGIPQEKVPITLDRFGNVGGPSLPLTITQGIPFPAGRPLTLMLLGYGVGLSWGAALIRLEQDVMIGHTEVAAEGAQDS
jgi:3-oxoacyl-[acyl-carrier-protein] synthase-3